MSRAWVVLFVAAGVLAASASEPAREPKAISVHPFGGQPGAKFMATVRGNSLLDATSAFLEEAPIAITIEGAEAEPRSEVSTKEKLPFDLVRVRVEVATTAKPGRYFFRLITPRGVSNALPLLITELPVAAESEGSHETPDTAVSIGKLPALVAGRIQRRGEADYYAFDAKAGQTLTFEAISGLPSTGGPGGNAVGFDPSLSIYESSGSWFDTKRVNRIAFNDEPLWVIGGPTDAQLTHTFEKAGRYVVRVEAFSGQGGPDYSYQLKIVSGAAPLERTPADTAWDERTFTRRLSADRLQELATRGGKPHDPSSIETYRAQGVFKLPGTLEGGLARPGEVHRARFHLDGPQDIAIEVETPETAPPLFNPIVRLLNNAGQEIATNVFSGRGACSGEMSKSIEAKTIVPLRDAGDYSIEIRDTTSDLSEPGFRYRIQVRPQIPHVGHVKIDADHINLAPGEAKTIRVTFDREEDYRGGVAVAAESLPLAVQALAGADFEADKDPPRYPGKRERYTPRTERIAVVFTASAEAAPMKEPQIARLVVRPVADGKPGAILQSKSIPVMVIAKQ